jgi:ribonuclease P protein component
MKYSFSRNLRLISTVQFKQVFSKAKRVTTQFGTIFYCYNNLNHPRLGVIVPKRNVKLANKRNRLKRIIRECFRLRQQQLATIDIIFLMNKEATNIVDQDLWNYLEKSWDRLVLLANKA